MYLKQHTRCYIFATLAVLFVPSYSVKHVSCNGECENSSYLTMPLFQCIHKKIENFPWSSPEERTAPSPNWTKASWYIYQDDNGEKAIALNFTWSQKGFSLAELVEGYSISVSKIYGASLNYQYNFENKTNMNIENHSEVYFNSVCIGRENPRFVQPGDNMFITLHALPTHNFNTEDQSVSCELKIPGCSKGEEEIDSTAYCKEEIRRDEEYMIDQDYTEMPILSETYKESFTALHGEPESDPTVIVAVLIGGLLIVVVLCLLYYVRTKCQLVPRTRKKYADRARQDVKSCLVLVSTAQTNVRSVYSEAVALLANIVQQHGRLKVECNLWELTGMEDPVNWMSEKLQKFQNIVLVCTPSGKQNMIRDPGGCCGDPFVMAMRVLMKRCKTSILSLDYNQTFTVVYFDSSAAVCVPDEVLRTSVKCYRLMPNFKEVFCRISGRRSDVIPPPVIETLKELTNKIVSLSITPSALTDKTIDPECCGLMECEARYATVSTWTTVDQKKRHCSSCPHAEQEEHSDNVPVTPFDSGFSGASTCTCDNSSHSCEGSQCSCVLDTMSSFSFREIPRSSHSETLFQQSFAR